MDSEEQNRIISEILNALNSKNGVLGKRINNLESAEYAILNFYGSMYQYNLGTVIAIAVAGTFYPVTGMVTGLLNGWTFSTPSLICVKPGIYGVNYNTSISNVANDNIHTAITQNGTVLSNTRADTLTAGAPGHANLVGVGIFRAVVGDSIQLAIMNATDADDPTIDSASVVLKRLGD